MDKDTEIREYESKDQHELKRFYLDMESKKRTSQVLHTLRQRSSAKRTLQAGLVGILGIHLSQYSIFSVKHTALLMVELLLWSAGLGVFWFKIIGQEYEAALNKNCQQMTDELAAIRKSEKSNVWIMTKQGHIIGTVAFKHESGEGKIGFLRGIDPQARLLLLKNAFRFGRAINIDVISKWKDDMKWSESALLTILDLSHNKLLKIPSNIDQLRNLKLLNLSHNNIHHLPASIYSLTSLTHFDVSYNPITRVSANIARLHNLNFLDLSNTEISSIPAELLNLFMTVIKTDHCPRLLDQSIELQQRTAHNPFSLVEICARQIIQPILYDIMAKKKKKRELKELQKQRYKTFQQLPNHIIYYLSRPKACSSCGGPYFQSFIVRYRIVQRQDESWIPVEYRLCSAHWNTEKERILSLFSDIPTSSLPPSTEPCQLKLVPSNSLKFNDT
ncbi:hypothetical protein BD408DRAFT_478020 [Parasitella parasitica]|nr:hypothetical protein BD408DRAFT_478020 [Parasitella parasitica]